MLWSCRSKASATTNKTDFIQICTKPVIFAREGLQEVILKNSNSLHNLMIISQDTTLSPFVIDIITNALMALSAE